MIEAAAQGRRRGRTGIAHATAVERALLELQHDLRQPLVAIAMLAETAQAQAQGVPSGVLECLERIEDLAQELLALCRSVFESAGERRIVSVAHLVGGVVATCRTSVSCSVELHAQHALAVTDEVALRRAVWNLLDNACRAAGPTGLVRVAVRQGTHDVTVEISDSGPGFGAGPTGAASMGLGVVGRLARQEGWSLKVAAGELGGAAMTLVMPAPVVALVPTGADAVEDRHAG